MMKIVEKHLVERYGQYSVMEGDIMSPVGEVTMCWVEDKTGYMVEGPTHIDTAIERAIALADEDFQQMIDGEDED